MIRLARTADIVLIADIERSAATLFAGTHMDIPASYTVNRPENLAHAIRRGLMWVADLPEGVSGFLYAEITGSGLYIRELSVAAAAQRRGFGTALLAAAIAEAGHRRLPAVLLTTDRTLPWNAPFYAARGFYPIADSAIPPDIQRRLASQYSVGFDPAARCAMILAIA